MKFKKIVFIFLIGLVGVMSSCVDDYFNIDPEIGEGEADLSATVVFSPVRNALGRDTRAAGDALKHIKSLCVFLYTKQGDDIKLYKRIPQAQLEGLEIENNNNATAPDAVGENEHVAETATPQATFTIKGIPFGRYYMYAVANMGNLDSYDDADLDTPEKLKAVPLQWQEDNIPVNDQMFGYFTATDNQTSQGFDAPAVIVNRPQMPLHAWVKRAASKVTVAIDGSGLNNGVQVWIKSIQIKDIPRDCFLGQNNVASNSDLLPDGEKFVINESMSAEGPSVTKQSPYYYPYMPAGTTSLENAHTEFQNALYFYENMQGEGQSKKQIWPDQEDKTTPKFPSGNDPNDKGFKDSKRNGTYIEVIGYYKGFKKGEAGQGMVESEGPIVYRFMLGKDTDKNYDAQRNYHYKLTLMLKGNANDTDWHIVYDPEPDIIIPSPYYISYLYDQSMNLPIKIYGKRLISLRADIEDNETNKNSWHPVDVTGKNDPNGGDLKAYWDGTPNNPGPWNGFLSLRKTAAARFGVWPAVEGFNDPLNPGGKLVFGPNEAVTYTSNRTYYDNNNRGWREYTVTNTGTVNDAEGNYTITTNGAGEWLVTVPLFTRAAVMVSQTAYTGNNPYVAYRRMAKVKFTAVVEGYDGKEHTVVCHPKDPMTVDKDDDAVTIYQMRRVVNPKGIWRPGNSVKPFHVKMMVLEGENNAEFVPLMSDGPWKAVIKNGDWFDLEPTPGKSQRNPDGTISGVGDMYAENNDGRVVDFTFRPKGPTSTPRGGLIKIYYNNYTCVHIIFVRQGYDPVSFTGSNTKWHSFNLKTATEEVSDPVEEGSYFRRYNTTLPIAASNNQSSMFSTQGGTVVWQNNADYDFEIAGQSGIKKKWSEITTDKDSWPSFNIKGKSCRLATGTDLSRILDNRNVTYGYGVLYTDETTETPIVVNDVYGAREGSTANKGMRGVFVCDTVTGTQIFLPIGATGYGRFKQKANGNYNRQKDGYSGVNQYANRWEPFPEATPESPISQPGMWSPMPYGVQYRPLFWDLYRRPGALYWLDGDNALDINYYTFAFDLTTQGSVGITWGSAGDDSGTDAILLRLVED